MNLPSPGTKTRATYDALLDGPKTSSEVSEITGIGPYHVTPFLVALRGKGLVNSELAPPDGRRAPGARPYTWSIVEPSTNGDGPIAAYDPDREGGGNSNQPAMPALGSTFKVVGLTLADNGDTIVVLQNENDVVYEVVLN